jgi:hypothetical protein
MKALAETTAGAYVQLFLARSAAAAEGRAIYTVEVEGGPVLRREVATRAELGRLILESLADFAPDEPEGTQA